MASKLDRPRSWPYWIAAGTSLAVAAAFYMNAIKFGSFSISNNDPQYLAMGRRSTWWGFAALGIALVFAFIGLKKVRSALSDE